MHELSEKTIFLQALEMESGELRARFLEEACAGDVLLRASIEKLLAAHDRPDNLLDQPLAEWKPKENEFTPTTYLDACQSAGLTETMIGPYRLMELIGEGGFGLVYVAEQQQPVRRRVAIKLIRPGMDTYEVIARFEAERQALAMMDHPNIARVLDAGVTDAGRPYFVMELVRGVPITEFCEQRQLTLPERLRLFVNVCLAVQHAHQKGVIHRDLKPSNVLVTLHDETPVVKVIDFGVAKAIGHSLTDKTIYTRFQSMIGTPLYMSPEQAEMSGLDVDTRSDIYSLGVLLYEVLTGTTPFDRQRFNSVSYDEVRRIIREEDPPRPSTRVTTLGKSRTTKMSQRVVSNSLDMTVIPGDLDWIVMKALEKDRVRRYDSAGSLAADIQRFLRDEPIEARPPSRFYELRKFSRRNRVALITTSIVAIAMMTGTAVSVWQAARAVDERNQKEIALKQALDARNDADAARRQIEDFADSLKDASILVTSGRAHAKAEQWADAYSDYTQAIRRQSAYFNAWNERAALEVQLGLWQMAAEDFSKSLELGVPADNPANWGIPQLFLLNGDVKRHRDICGELIQQARSTNKPLSLSTIRSCLIASNPVGDSREFEQSVEEAIANLPPQRMGDPRRPPPGRGPKPESRDSKDVRHPRQERGERPPGPGLPPPLHELLPHLGAGGPPRHGGPPGEAGRFFEGRIHHPYAVHYYVAGMAHYRAGNLSQAVDRLRQAVDDREWRAKAVVQFPLAMALHRSGQADDARKAYELGQQAIDEWTGEILDAPVGRMPMPWFEWVEALVLYREAAILLTGFVPAEDPRLAEIERRALDAISADQPPR